MIQNKGFAAGMRLYTVAVAGDDFQVAVFLLPVVLGQKLSRLQVGRNWTSPEGCKTGACEESLESY